MKNHAMANNIVDLNSIWDLSGQLLKEAKKVRVKVTGTSMFPFIRDGDLVLIEPMGGKQKEWPLKPGTVVCLQQKGRCVVHRIVQFPDKDRVVTRSDFYRAKDPAVSREQLLGIATRRWRETAGGEGRPVRRISPGIVAMLRPLARLWYRIRQS